MKNYIVKTGKEERLMKFQGFQTRVNQRRSFSEVGRSRECTTDITHILWLPLLHKVILVSFLLILASSSGGCSWSDSAIRVGLRRQSYRQGQGRRCLHFFPRSVQTVFAFLPQICAAYMLVVSFQKELKKTKQKQKQKQSKNKTKQNKTKRNETKRNETKRNETKRNKTNKTNQKKQNKAKQNKNKTETKTGKRVKKIFLHT